MPAVEDGGDKILSRTQSQNVCTVHTYVCTVHVYIRMYVCTVCLYVCMYVCMYCMYACMYVRMYVCTYVCMYVRTYIRMYVCMYVCMYVLYCTYVCTYVLYVCMYVCMYVRISSPFLSLPSLFPAFPSLTLSFQMLRRMDGRFGRVKTEHDTSLWTTVSETALIGDR